MIETFIGYLNDPQFWTGLVQIIIIDILLSGDNAVVIALAVRSLPPAQQRKGIIFGAGAAIGLRVIFATVITYLMQVPILKIAGGLMLFWIAVKLIAPDEEGEGEGIDPARNLMQAIKTIVIADAVMSLDNVIGIAAAAKGNVVLLILGLLISIPLIIYGSTLILKLLDRFPIIVLAGGALLGWIGGEIIVTDPVVHEWVMAHAPWLETHRVAHIAGAVLVVALGRWVGRRRSAAAARRKVVDLAKEGPHG